MVAGSMAWGGVFASEELLPWAPFARELARRGLTIMVREVERRQR